MLIMSFKDQPDTSNSHILDTQPPVAATPSAENSNPTPNLAQTHAASNPHHIQHLPGHQMMTPPAYTNHPDAPVPVISLVFYGKICALITVLQHHHHFYAKQYGTAPYLHNLPGQRLFVSSHHHHQSYPRAYAPLIGCHSSPPAHSSSPSLAPADTRPSAPSQVEIKVEKNQVATAWDTDNDDPPPMPTLSEKPQNTNNGSTKQAKASAAERPIKKEVEKQEKPTGVDGIDQRKRGRGGRSEGSRNFSEREMRKIVELVHLKKPLGSDIWMDVEGLYNEWAGKHSFLCHDSRSLKNKFDQVCQSRLAFFITLLI